ncbi:MAG: hypothetical protein KF764_21115 [Labilithrix sp.]|nr:hypothetical protein [Labilithrix sp.]MBX3222280.1 hypothetical protein [Labilithrix sp.]
MRLGLVFVLAAGVASGCSLLVGEGLSGGSGGAEDPADANDDAPSVPGNEGGLDGAPPLPPRPREGVYAYVISGKDTLSFGPVTTSYGPTASATVVNREGAGSCFTMTLALRSGYTDAQDFCVREDAIVRTGGRRRQFFQVLSGVDVNTSMVCEPGDVFNVAAPVVGETKTHLCTGKNVESENGESPFSSGGTYRYVGEETIKVGSSDVRVRHFREELTVTGEQTGKNELDWYFAVESGVLVRLVRKVAIVFPRAFETTYAENADLSLVALEPAPLPVDAGSDAAK